MFAPIISPRKGEISEYESQFADISRFEVKLLNRGMRIFRNKSFFFIFIIFFSSFVLLFPFLYLLIDKTTHSNFNLPPLHHLYPSSSRCPSSTTPLRHLLFRLQHIHVYEALVHFQPF